jgi:S-formylglutathione hydrolase FrmB
MLIGDKPAWVHRPARATHTLLWLHDVDERPPIDWVTEFDHHRLAAVAPWGGPSYWTDRPCPAFDPHYSATERLLTSVVPWIAEHLPPLRAVCGVGIGGQAAVRLGFQHPERFLVVAGWDGHFDFHDDYDRGTPLDELFDRKEQARQATAILHIRPVTHGLTVWFGCPPTSPRFRGHDRLHEKLTAVGVPHTAVVGDGGVRSMIEVVAAAVTAKSRSLL